MESEKKKEIVTKATYISSVGLPYGSIKVTENCGLIGGQFKYPIISSILSDIKEGIIKKGDSIKIISIGDDTSNFTKYTKGIQDAIPFLKYGIRMGFLNITMVDHINVQMISIYDYINDNCKKNDVFRFDISYCNRYIAHAIILAAQHIQEVKNASCKIITIVDEANEVDDESYRYLYDNNSPAVAASVLLSNIGLI